MTRKQLMDYEKIRRTFAESNMRSNPDTWTKADYDAQLAADLQAEKEAREAYEEEMRLIREADERAFYDNPANAKPARDQFSPARPMPAIDPDHLPD